MTREEATNILYGMKGNYLNLDLLCVKDKYEALDMAIKALKQEPVLDKVRAEIEDLADADAYGDYQQGFSYGLMRAVQVIDKYIESEDKE